MVCRIMTASSSILHEWVNQYSDSLYTWACYKTSDPQLAEDLVQDTFLVACKTMEQFRQQSFGLQTIQSWPSTGSVI
jgi:DNA-directed RNA polymerase specialized sigma24 family protein